MADTSAIVLPLNWTRVTHFHELLLKKGLDHYWAFLRLLDCTAEDKRQRGTEREHDMTAKGSLQRTSSWGARSMR